MIAAELIEPQRFELSETAPPDPGAGEVLIQIEGCGLCASNLGPWGGVEGVSYPLEPGAPGHEVYGTVAAVGPDVGGVAEGDSVTALTYNGFADYDLADAGAVVPLPDGLAGRPVLGEPLACAVNVARRAGIEAGDTVVVVGAGFLGTIVMRLARRADPERVIAVSRRPTSLEMAGRMGADERLTYEDDVAGRISELTDGGMADVVIEATGKPAPLDLAAGLVRVRGRLVIAGYHQDGQRTVNMQSWNWRGLDVINAHERDPVVYTRGMKEGVRLMAAGALDLEPLVSDVFPLSEINAAFETAASRPEGFFKAVVAPGAER